MGQETPKNTYVTLHKNFVRTDIEYADRRTGEVKTFNSVTLPKGTVIDGCDVPRRGLPRHPPSHGEGGLAP